MFQSSNFLCNPSYGYEVEELHYRSGRFERSSKGMIDVAARHNGATILHKTNIVSSAATGSLASPRSLRRQKQSTASCTHGSPTSTWTTPRTVDDSEAGQLSNETEHPPLGGSSYSTPGALQKHGGATSDTTPDNGQTFTHKSGWTLPTSSLSRSNSPCTSPTHSPRKNGSEAATARHGLNASPNSGRGGAEDNSAARIKSRLPRKTCLKKRRGKRRSSVSNRKLRSKSPGHIYYDSKKRPFKIRASKPHTAYKQGGGYLYDSGKQSQYIVFAPKGYYVGPNGELRPKKKKGTGGAKASVAKANSAKEPSNEVVVETRSPGSPRTMKHWRKSIDRHLHFHEGASIKVKVANEVPHPRGPRGRIEDEAAQELARNGPRPRFPFEEPEPPRLW